jgi:hypothetical protein
MIFYAPSISSFFLVLMLLLQRSWFWIDRVERRVKNMFILDTGNHFLILWTARRGGYGRGKFRDVVFKIHQRVRGVSCMKPGMIRQWSHWLASTVLRLRLFCYSLHLSSTLTHHLFPLELLALNGRSIHQGEGSERYSRKTALDLFLHGQGQGDR